MITIRLTRVGKKKMPTYRLVIQDKLRDPWGKAIEIVGSYNPHTKPKTIVLKEEAIKSWIAKGAQPSATVRNMLIDAKVMAGEKVRSSTSNKPKTKKK